MTASRRVLVTDGQWRKALAVVRALGRRGHAVDVAGDRALTTSFFSKYCAARHVFPVASVDPDGFLAGLRARLERGAYDLLIPLEDESVLACARHRDELERHAVIPLPAYDTVLAASDKARTLAAAAECGIPIPVSHAFSEWAAVEAALPSLVAPRIVKPRRGAGSRGIVRVRQTDELLGAYRSAHAQQPFPIVQELIPAGGESRGVSVLMDRDGRVWAHFVHQRIREYPVSGGPSTLRVSVHDEALVERSVGLLRHIGWQGMAMVEWKRDPRDGEWKLLEINPRFVGSLQLAISAGVDFPSLLCEAFLGGGEPPPVPDYADGILCRWLLPGDLLHFVANPDRFSLEPSFFEFRAPNLSYDVCSWDDPLPVVGRLLAMLALLFDGPTRAMVFGRSG